MPLVYDWPQATEKHGELTVALLPVQDERRDRELDEYVVGPLAVSVGDALRREIAAHPAVTRVVAETKCSTGYDVVVSPSLLALQATIPSEQIAAAGGLLVPELLLPGLGGRVDGRVRARAELRVVVFDSVCSVQADRLLTGEADLEVPLAYMATPQTNSRVAGMALKQSLGTLGDAVDAAMSEDEETRSRSALRE